MSYKNILILALVIVAFKNPINAQDMWETKVLEIINSNKSPVLRYNLSLPVVDMQTDTLNNWNIKYYVIIEDTTIQQFCDSENSQKYISALIKLLDNDKYVWQANIMLYSITKINAIELQVYTPNNIQNWIKNQKQKDINFWKEYLK